jgi:hypothetical protein
MAGFFVWDIKDLVSFREDPISVSNRCDYSDFDITIAKFGHLMQYEISKTLTAISKSNFNYRQHFVALSKKEQSWL